MPHEYIKANTKDNRINNTSEKEIKYALNEENFPSDIKGIQALEEKHLAIVLNKVDDEIEKIKRDMPYSGIGKYEVAADKDDRYDLMYKKSMNAVSYDKINKLSDIKYCPYFARMDFLISHGNNEHPEKVYIGKKAIFINGEYVVFDWRSPVGQRYYLKNVLNFKHNDYSYKLFQRRSIDIENSCLNNVFQEYFDPTVISKNTKNIQKSKSRDKKVEDISAVGKEVIEELSKSITDPFLVNVLKKKRADFELTDIIRTIQGNQNNIINYPIEANIVVQGCAGSGKTMILLHRLSYLKYNYKNLDLDRVKIITPNELFDLHINNLTKTLELDRIERLTIEQYYQKLLLRYGKEWDFSKKALISENLLDCQYINYIYSADFFKRLKKEYNKRNHNLDQYALKVRDYAEEYSINYNEDIERTCKQRIDYLISMISEVFSQVGKYEREIELAKREEDKANSVLMQHNAIYEGQKELLYKKIDTLARLINNEIQEQVSYKELLYKELENIVSEKKNGLLELEESFKRENNFIKSLLGIGRSKHKFEINKAKQEISAFELELDKCREAISKYNRLIIKDSKSLSLSDSKALIEQLNIYRDEINIVILEIEKLQAEMKINEMKLKNLEKRNTDITKQLNSKILTVPEKSELSHIKQYLENQLPTKIFQTVFKETFVGVMDLKNIKYKDRQSKALLYAKLAFCLLYYGKLFRADKMLCIDEGQDISLTEYEIINQVNGGITFNVYGDTNQLIKEGRGIDNWDGFLMENGAKLFVLNENYRNSVEINDYCNSYFGFNSLSVGVSCGKVKEITKAIFLKGIQGVQPGKKRIGVIVKDAKSIESPLVKQIFECNRIVKNKCLQGVISLLTVEQCKGLEFDDVYVIPEGMTKNERYIAYTRALNHLTIVNS